MLHIVMISAVTAVEQFERADTDPLLNIFNRRRLSDDTSSSCKSNDETSILFFDIDKFKEINTNFGHPNADLILQKIADSLQRIANKHKGGLYRYGGEELVLLGPRWNSEKAISVAETARLTVSRLKYDFIDKPLKVTVSCGVATCPVDSKNASDLIEKSDEAMYVAKAKGRNRVVTYEMVENLPSEERAALKQQEKQELWTVVESKYIGILRDHFLQRFRLLSHGIVIRINDNLGKNVKVEETRVIELRTNFKEKEDRIGFHYFSDGTIVDFACDVDAKVHSVVQITKNSWLVEYEPTKSYRKGEKIILETMVVHEDAFLNDKEYFSMNFSWQGNPVNLDASVIFPDERPSQITELTGADGVVIESISDPHGEARFSIKEAFDHYSINWHLLKA